MINYLPPIYPDELVYSWFCRYYAHSGCFTHKMALEDLFLKRCHNPSKEFIGHLNPQAQEKIKEMYSMEYLILNHTMYSQYARFIPLKEKKKALHHLGYEFCDPHYLFTLLPRTKSELYLRYCPLCVKEDREKYGETYWHRKHQIRNIQTCSKHRCLLESSEVAAKSEGAYTFCVAEEFTEETIPIMANSFHQSFSEFLTSVFDSPLDLERDTPIGAILHYALFDTKYISKTHITKNTKLLTEDIQSFYAKMGISDIASMNQIQRLWCGDRFDFSVICQIAYFLGMRVEDLVNPNLSAEQINAERDTHYMKGKSTVDWPALDDEISPQLEELAGAVYSGLESEIGRPERVSEKMVYRELGLEKHRLDNMPKCRAILDRFKESYEENWARRLIWAYQKLKSEYEDNPFYWSDMRKLAGVKKAKLELVIPYIYKHTDALTANTIISVFQMQPTK